FNSDQISLTSGSSTSVRGNLGSDAASVTATITDDNGKVVRTLKFGGAAAGQFSSTWDGRDDAGTLLPTGNYHLKLAATDSSGKAVTTVTEGYGRVTGISYATGTAELLVGGTHVQLADVLEIDQPTSN
ncbi:MAG: flagellar hook assembly protein FlgD, partial [Deltaproteobacteria bacterium]|nr:flagellar hook assembly protein FlgD [Deltaproteobacteria bacterium]